MSSIQKIGHAFPYQFHSHDKIQRNYNNNAEIGPLQTANKEDTSANRALEKNHTLPDVRWSSK